MAVKYAEPVILQNGEYGQNAEVILDDILNQVYR
jgi:uncharacterized protein YegJ (DUF2314 family)